MSLMRLLLASWLSLPLTYLVVCIQCRPRELLHVLCSLSLISFSEYCLFKAILNSNPFLTHLPPFLTIRQASSRFFPELVSLLTVSAVSAVLFLFMIWLWLSFVPFSSEVFCFFLAHSISYLGSAAPSALRRTWSLIPFVSFLFDYFFLFSLHADHCLSTLFQITIVYLHMLHTLAFTGLSSFSLILSASISASISTSIRSIVVCRMGQGIYSIAVSVLFSYALLRNRLMAISRWLLTTPAVIFEWFSSYSVLICFTLNNIMTGLALPGYHN